MKNWQSKVPPYTGDEPYLYFAFAEADSAKVWNIMRPLLARGCRIWYMCGNAGTGEAMLARQACAGGAALTLLYLTDAACADPDTKSFVLVNQKFGRPIIALDPDGVDRRLKFGLRENTPHVPLYKYRTDEEKESAIIHTEGFSQDIIGTPITVSGGSLIGNLSKAFCLVAVLLAIISVVGLKFFQKPQPEVEVTDEVTFSDPVILEAVREEADGGVITEELVSDITILHLSDVPENWDELSMFPSLEMIELPQEAVMQTEDLPDGYTIALSRGDVS